MIIEGEGDRERGGGGEEQNSCTGDLFLRKPLYKDPSLDEQLISYANIYEPVFMKTGFNNIKLTI